MNITLYDIIYSVRYYPLFSLTTVDLRTYYPQIRRSTCILWFWPQNFHLWCRASNTH